MNAQRDSGGVSGEDGELIELAARLERVSDIGIAISRQGAANCVRAIRALLAERDGLSKRCDEFASDNNDAHAEAILLTGKLSASNAALAAKRMTANPDSALRQALVAAEKTLAWIADRADKGGRRLDTAMNTCDQIEAAAREAHALITEALKDKL